MASLLKRVVLRYTKLKGVATDARAVLDKCTTTGATQEEFTASHLKLKQCLEAFDKELHGYLNIVPDADVNDMTDEQLQAEDILTELETAVQINVKKSSFSLKSKLPELSLPTFSGDRLKWCEFWDRFAANVDGRDLPESEKLMYLLSCLEGTAKDTVSGLTATNANYSIAVETLKQRFGSSDALIDAHYTALGNLQKAQETSASCRCVLDSIEQNLRVLEKLGEPIGGNHLRALVLSKFPEKVIHEHHLRSSDSNDLTSIRSSLNRIITAMEKSAAFIPVLGMALPGVSATTEALQVRTEVQPNGRKRRSTRQDNLPPTKRTRRQCLFCSDRNHVSADCPKYTSVDSRQGRVSGRCLHCLRRSHVTAACRRKISCFRCKGNHLAMFCPQPKPTSNGKGSITCNEVDAMCAVSKGYTFLQTAVATIVNPLTGRSRRGRILLDGGSQRSYVCQDAARDLGLSAPQEDILLIYTFGASEPRKMSSPSTTVNVQTKRGVVKQLTVNIVPRITDGIAVASLQHPGADILADDNTAGETIDLLIGNDFYSAILRGNKIKVSTNLYLLDTDFGWVVSGSATPEETGDILSVVTYCQCHTPSCPYFTEPDLPLRNIDVKFLWSLENIGITDSPKATRQEEAVRHFNETAKYQDGRYMVKWPWIEYPPDLPSNFGLALGRLKSVLRRLDAESLHEYDAILKEQQELGIIEVIDEPNADTEHPLHYLAHHMVKQKAGKRGRIVYDASAKAVGLKSLNECLYSGPSMLEDLTALLLKFRTKKIGILADVEKAFLQVALQEEDRDVTRFLWIKDTTKEATEDNLLCLRFCRVAFGIVSSPFLLQATIRHHICQTNKALLKPIADKCYVDNLVTGADTLREAEQIYSQTRTVFDQLSMNMRDWISNSQSFIDMIPEQHRSDNSGNVKVLGLAWNIHDDKLKLNLSESHFSTEPPVDTKRKVLRALARVYDPCGFVCPLMLSMKLIYQNICQKKCKWDTELPAELTSSVKSVLEGLKIIEKIEIPRYIGSSTAENGLRYHLHCFTDASMDAYAAVVYLKVMREQQGQVISFIMAKSHISEAKDKDDLKIPKLELLGFLIGSRLLKYVRRHLELDIEKEYLWSDSLVVLSWMKSNKLLAPFVANRVNEIKRDHPNTEMLYVHTKSNPADVATRPELFQEKMDLWFHGPEFLIEDEVNWPENRLYEVHRNLLSVGEALDDGPGEPTQDTEMNGDAGQERRDNHRDPTQDISQPIEISAYPTDELMELDSPDDQMQGRESHQQAPVTRMLTEIKEVQKQHFQEELDGKRTHLARNLDLFIDVDGVLRCRGRMANTTWSYDSKYPILVPKDSEFTERIIKDAHENNYHVGAPHTLSIIRERYWIPQGKAQVLKVIRRCSQCIKHGGGPYRLPAAPALPPERVNYNRPYTYTGVDYLGPLFVSTPNGKKKRWVALFTCLTVRAIHLEIVNDLSAEECLLALRRFAAARNKPQRMYSDNATCFKLVSEVVKQSYCVDNDIEWKFIPQLAPWHGGYYERLVALVKHCLKRTLEKHLLNDSRLLTVMKEVEAVLNSRPLTRIGTEVEHILCPADFLSMGQCLVISPSAAEVAGDNTVTKRVLIESWKRGHKILEEFKKMFIGQYLSSLRERYNNAPKQPRVMSHRTPRVGDLVQIKAEIKNRNSWKVGKIDELLKGQDGQCRVAKVKVDNSILTRSIGHLYPLEIDNENTPEVDSAARNVTQTAEMNTPEDSVPEASGERADAEMGTQADGEVSIHDDVAQPEEQQEERREDRSKRVAATRARAKILEWTRHLLALLR